MPSAFPTLTTDSGGDKVEIATREKMKNSVRAALTRFVSSSKAILTGILLFFLESTASAHADSVVKTAPPLSAVDVAAFCVDCDERFGIKTHSEILEGLAGNVYIQSLRNALYFQDFVHQFESKAHFDNCDMDGAISYLQERLALVGTYATSADLTSAKSEATRKARLRQAFFALGQALHIIQDFYAHTNYIELESRKYSRLAKMTIVPLWTAAGRQRLAQLRADGLVSGRVSWGFPKHCPATVPTHGALAKDSESTEAGKIILPNLEGLSQFKVAKHLARQASLDLVRTIYELHPILKKESGPDIAFEVLLDNRPADN